MRNIQWFWIGLCILSLFCVGGCTHVWHLSNARLDPVANPNGGPPVKIVAVTDRRVFEIDPKDIQTPTVRDSRDIANRAVTLRAAGKAKANGHTFFFTYDEGQSVETAVRGAVENALRNKGYSVVADNSPSAANAIPIEVDIRKDWNWMIIGLWTVEDLFVIDTDVKSPIVLNGGTESVSAHYDISSPFMVTAVCEHCIGNGLEVFVTNLQAKLKSPK